MIKKIFLICMFSIYFFQPLFAEKINHFTRDTFASDTTPCILRRIDSSRFGSFCDSSGASLSLKSFKSISKQFFFIRTYDRSTGVEKTITVYLSNKGDRFNVDSCLVNSAAVSRKMLSKVRKSSFKFLKNVNGFFISSCYISGGSDNLFLYRVDESIRFGAFCFGMCGFDALSNHLRTVCKIFY
jgi:hypothetical protein